MDSYTTPNGVTVVGSPNGGYGMGYGGNWGQARQNENFLASLILLNSQQEGFHHVLNREAQIRRTSPRTGSYPGRCLCFAECDDQQAAAYALNAANEVSPVRACLR